MDHLDRLPIPCPRQKNRHHHADIQNHSLSFYLFLASVIDQHLVLPVTKPAPSLVPAPRILPHIATGHITASVCIVLRALREAGREPPGHRVPSPPGRACAKRHQLRPGLVLELEDLLVVLWRRQGGTGRAGPPPPAYPPLPYGADKITVDKIFWVNYPNFIMMQ